MPKGRVPRPGIRLLRILDDCGDGRDGRL